MTTWTKIPEPEDDEWLEYHTDHNGVLVKVFGWTGEYSVRYIKGKTRMVPRVPDDICADLDMTKKWAIDNLSNHQ